MTATPLEELAAKYIPSKRLHNYMHWYWMYFQGIRQDVRRVLEIGVDKGTSLFTWRDFFPNAEIVGLDINPRCREFEGERIKVFVGDQSDTAFLASVDQAAGPFDIVIDDGSHLPEHQLISFRHFIRTMSPRGIYVIEDIGVGRGPDRTWVNSALAGLIQNINYWDYDLCSEEWPYMNRFPEHASFLDRSIVGVAFHRYICFVMKGGNPGDNTFLQDKSLAPSQNR